MFNREPSKEGFFANRRKDYKMDHAERTTFERYMPQATTEAEPFRPSEPKSSHPYQFNEDYKLGRREGAFDRNLIDRETVTKRITKEQANPFRHHNESRENNTFCDERSESSLAEKAPLREISNNFYPTVDDILKSKSSASGMDVKSPIGENGSLNRIREEILKSRKLVEELKRHEGIKY